MKIIDLLGRKFGKWIVLSRGENSKEGKARWICQCECGNKNLIYSCNLLSNKSKNCQKCKNIVHGYTKTHTYIIYYSMIQRCMNSKNKFFLRYGGRGIKICERWLESFENFLEDMQEIPDKLTIDRINNNLGYCKENCRVVSRKENSRNREISIRLNEIRNNWIVLQRAEKYKYYDIQCINCGFIKTVRGNTYKVIKKHICEKKK